MVLVFSLFVQFQSVPSNGVLALESETTESVLETVTNEISLPEAVEESVTEPVVEVAEETSQPEVEQVPAQTETPEVEVVEEDNSNVEVLPPAEPEQAPELSTDKDDYHPGETASIFGKFFGSLKTYAIKVFGGDDSNYTETESEIASDDGGEFQYDYTLDNVYRPYYEVVVSDDSGKVAETYFLDSAVGTYDQCSNDDGDGYASGDTGCRWTNGNIQANNSIYFEGDSTVQRLWMNGYVAGATSRTVTFKYGTTKGGNHAYDYLTTWDASESWITLADRCQDITGCTTAGETTAAMENDPNLTDTIEPAGAGRFFTIRGGTITDVSVPSIDSGTYAGDSETVVTVTFDVANSGSMCTTSKVQGQDVISCGVALWFGAHIAESSEWDDFDGTTGAGSIPGSPYHVALDSADGESIGQRDNQMQSAAIIANGNITIVKNTVPNDAQDFAFSATGAGLSGFSLDDDGDGTLPNSSTFSVAPGNYTVTEGSVTGWALTNLVCSDPTTNSSVNIGTRTASINLASNETVTCTFTNTLQTGHIIVDKVTVPAGDSQSFSFDAAGGSYTDFALADATAPNNQELVAGTYSVMETVPAGWDLTSATCSDQSPVTAISLQAGETVTCTFTNTKRGTILVDKVTNPAGSNQSFEFDSDYGTNFNLTDAAPANDSGFLTPGTYSVDELTPTGWDETSATCSDQSPVTAISLQAGETVTCTFTNTQRGHIVVDKVTIPALDAQSFDFTAGGAGYNNFSLTDAAAANNQEVVPGAYSVSETLPAGWNQTSATCDKGETIASIDVGPGETVTCTFTNTKLTTSTSTELHKADESVVTDGSSVALGTTMHDKAVVTSNIGTPTGTVAFTFFTNIACEGQGTASGTVALDSGIAHPSDPQGPLAAGSYSFKAHYNGDGNYPASDSPCEPFIVNKAQLAVTTTIHKENHDILLDGGHVVLGSLMHDNADVTGEVAGFAIPAITFTLNGDPVANASAEAGFDATSAPSAGLAAGNYTYQATVASDGNYEGATSAPEPFVVDKGRLIVTTAVHNSAHEDKTGGNVPLGSVVHDTATITGEAFGFPQPTPTFTLTSNYSESCADGSVVGNDGKEDVAFKSANTAALTPGQYAFRAVSPENENYLEAVGECEPFTVDKAQLAITTTIHDSAHGVIADNSNVPLGTNTHDNADVTGEVAGFGIPAISFTLNSNPIGNAAAEGSFDATSVASGALAAGNYTYNATVASNEYYLGATSAPEPFVVDKGNTETSTIIHNAAHAAVLAVPTGTTVHDSATVSGTSFGTPTGNVVFDWFLNGDCTGAAAATSSTFALAGGTVDATGFSFTVNNPGMRSFKAHYQGNDDYNGSDGPCEPLKVVDARISITPSSSTNAVGDDHTFVVLVEQNDGTGWAPVPAGTLANAISNPAPGSFDVSDCNDGVDANGQCNVIINSNVPGVFTITARSTVTVEGIEFKLVTNGVGGNSGPAVKTYVDARIKIDPNQATNPVNAAHTFTVTVEQNLGDGNGYVPVAGALVDVVVTPEPDGGLNEADCNDGTAANGQCVAIINSSSPGVFTAIARSKIDVSGIEFKLQTNGQNGNSSPATKTYEAGKIIVVKQTLPDGDDTVFDFDLSYGDGDADLSDGQTDDSGFLAPGSGYTVAENVPSGWDLTSATCDDGSLVSNISVAAGETVTCTFNNTKRGHLIVQKTTVPAADLTEFTISASGTGTITGGGAGIVTDATDKDYEVTPGTYSVVETVPAGWDKTADTCQNVAVAAGQTATCGFTNVKQGSITIVKDAQPNDCQDFAFTFTGKPNFSLDDNSGVQDCVDTDQSVSSVFSNLPANAVYTAVETNPNSFWKLNAVNCTEGAQVVVNLAAGSAAVTLQPGQNVSCTFVNEKTSPTRTQGFWQTHTTYTTGVFNTFGGTFRIGGGVNQDPINTPGKLFGAFFSNIAKTTTNQQRTALDKARMQLAQQLAAAKLNCKAFGCSQSVMDMIATADAHYQTGTAAQILADVSLIDAYNNSGDTIIIGNAGKATPKDSQNLADKVFWNTP
jgi:hypothetical protein